ncbi:hypothetical protein FQR65_LT00325 [Abscondita terminalis]|nr:hypothetical protein FQR65_LT00325 [Abscondita terminalis]
MYVIDQKLKINKEKEDKRSAGKENDLKQEIAKLRNEVTIIHKGIEKMKKSIMREHTMKIMVYLDKIMESMNQKASFESVFVSDIPCNMDLLTSYNFPLRTVTEIKSLDRDIQSNPEFKIQLIDMLSKIAGTTGMEDGIKISYRVFDYLFSSMLLTKFTWTGVCRDKGLADKKIAFQKFDGIMATTFEVVLKADDRHTKKKHEEFVKDKILKFAKKRNARKSAIRTDIKLDSSEQSNAEGIIEEFLIK